MTDFRPPYPPQPGTQQAPTGQSPNRSRLMFVNLKNRLHLPGVNELLAPCTQHLTASQYKRMMGAWQAMDQYQVFGFVQYGRVIGILALEVVDRISGRVLTLAVVQNQQGRGLGRRLVVEAFCTLDLQEMNAKTLEDNLGFYQKLHFETGHPQMVEGGMMVYTCVLTRQALYRAYIHEYSAGAVLYTQGGEERLYVLVTELSGNTGLPKGHVEAGETDEQTALREIYEETGIRASLVPGFGGELVYPQGRGMLKHFTYFLAVFDDGQFPVSGADVIAHILPYDQALRKLSFSDVRSILRQAEAFLNAGGMAAAQTAEPD